MSLNNWNKSGCFQVNKLLLIQNDESFFFWKKSIPMLAENAILIKTNAPADMLIFGTQVKR